MGGHHERAGERPQRALDDVERAEVEVVRRLVEQHELAPAATIVATCSRERSPGLSRPRGRSMTCSSKR